MNGENWNATPGDWEDLIDSLLSRKHGANFQKVPDRDKGDYGIESFTTDNYAVYQCYAAEEPIAIKALYEKQRDKITADIRKFINNEDSLKKILGSIKVKNWILVVPRFDSADLLKHATAKAAEVLQHNLSYVDPKFCIRITTADLWRVEREELVRYGLSQINIEPSTQKQTVSALSNPEFISNLRRKIELLMPESSASEVDKIKKQFTEYYLDGESVLDQLQKEYPSFYADARSAKETKEKYLSVESKITTSEPGDHLNATLESFKEALTKKLGGVSQETIEALSWGTLAGWLLHCPLDFVDRS